MLFRLSNAVNSQEPPRELLQPSKTLSTALLLPSPPPLTRISTANSTFPPPPTGPSPLVPNTSLSLSYPRSLMGIKTPQNFSGVDSGGGGVRYAVDMWVRRIGGWAITCVRDGEKDVWVRSGRSEDG